MYLLSPGGGTVFHIPGIEVVHALPHAKVGMEGKMQPPLGNQSASRKRQSLTLDLNSASAKKNRVQNLLTSPDVQMLKLTSPELEKFLSQNPTLATPTPSGYVFPKSVTEEQMMYAKGFEEALEHLRKVDQVTDGSDAAAAAATTLASLSNVPIPVLNSTVPAASDAAAAAALPLSLSSAATSESSLSRPGSSASGSDTYQIPDGVKIKDEPSDDSLLGHMSPDESHTSGMSPINMESQEKIKLERKRLRNRLAASKCRRRKLERISHLDDRVKQLKNENSDLAAVVKKLKSSVAALKQEVIEHVNSGCEIMMTDAANFS